MRRPHLEGRLLPVAVLLIAQLAVGSAALMARTGLEHGLSALSLAAWRLTLASLVLVGLLRLRPRSEAQPRLVLTPRDRLRLVAAGVCLALHFLAWFASLRYVPVARSTLLVATTPLWSGLADILLLRRRLPMIFWIGLALASVGVWGVTLGGAAPARGGFVSGPPLLGDALAVAGAILLAVYFVLVQGVQDRQGTGRTIAWTYSCAALSLWPAVLLLGGRADRFPGNAPAWAAVLGMALVPQLVGHTALNWSLTRFAAGAVATATLLEPVFASALAWSIYGEALTVMQGIGAAVLLAGVAIALRGGGTEEPAEG
jgi:drug/metabolite transporter (DMT)-like permease